jgi:hypothetical protein
MTTMDKDVVVEVRRVPEGFVTECNVRGPKEMFALVKSLKVLHKQLKEKIQKDYLDGDVDCDDGDCIVCEGSSAAEARADMLKKIAHMKGDKELIEIIEKVDKLGKEKDHKALKQLLKDIKGLLDGK